MSRARKLPAALASVCAPVVAGAQELPSAPHLSISQRSAFLLMNPAVRAQVKLQSSQESAVATAADNYSAQQMRLLTSKNAIEREIRENDAKFAKAALTAISPQQRKELLALAVKKVGTPALADKDLAKQLGLTKNQTTKIGGLLQARTERLEVLDEMIAKGLDYIPKPKKGETTERYDGERAAMVKAYDAERQKLKKDTDAIDAKIVATLTASQRSQWKSWAG